MAVLECPGVSWGILGCPGVIRLTVFYADAGYTSYHSHRLHERSLSEDKEGVGSLNTAYSPKYTFNFPSPFVTHCVFGENENLSLPSNPFSVDCISLFRVVVHWVRKPHSSPCFPLISARGDV